MIARGTGFVRGASAKAQARLIAHIRYLLRKDAAGGAGRGSENEAAGGPPQPVQRPILFSRDADLVATRDAVSGIMSQTTARVKFHKVVLSPGPDEPVATRLTGMQCTIPIPRIHMCM
jgi:hypothetical protein